MTANLIRGNSVGWYIDKQANTFLCCCQRSWTDFVCAADVSFCSPTRNSPSCRGSFTVSLTLWDVQETRCAVVSPGILLLSPFDATPLETFAKFL